MLFRKPKHNYSLDEVHRYTLDLERITFLRDKSLSKEEAAKYDGEVKIMQIILDRLLERLDGET